jgi:hypothetical protein
MKKIKTIHFLHGAQITGFDLQKAKQHFSNVSNKSIEEVYKILDEQSTPEGLLSNIIWAKWHLVIFVVRWQTL